MGVLPLLGETDPLVFTPATAGGDEFDNAEGATELAIWNRAGRTREVQLVEQRDCLFGEKGSHESALVSLAPGAMTRVRKFAIYRYNNASARVEITYPSGESGLELAALYRPPI